MNVAANAPASNAAPEAATPLHLHGEQLVSGPRISRLTMARLVNLGNFEHVRYEFTVEVPLGTSPSSVARTLLDIFEKLAEPKPVSDFAFGAALKNARDPQRPTEVRVDAERIILARRTWEDQKERALALLDSLGGIVRHGCSVPASAGDDDRDEYWGAGGPL